MDASRFKICIYCVGVQCKKNGELANGASQSEGAVLRFCEKIGQAADCNSAETVGSLNQAEAIRQERGIS